MEIVGRGFLAGHLAALADHHPDTVVLAAGVSAAGDIGPEQYTRESVRLYETLRYCERHGKRLVFFSTASAGMYSVPDGSPGREDGPVYPATPYGRHKLSLEAVVKSSDVEYLILRLSHVVGFHQPPHQLLPSLVRQLSSGRLTVYRGARRDLVDVEDVVKIVHTLLVDGRTRDVVNVASGYAPGIEDVVDHMEQLLGTSAEKTYVQASGAQPVSIAKLCRLVPTVYGLGFGPDYYRAVLDKYVHAYVQQPV
ncbi:NAD-dependent epimerase/dehydratase family protein [Streptomyces spinosirectus]|jgi:nucleoside-diphosphate-sugar epimerase|uniref:NAD-dependent epimerase/dehydratase family protein n=1 Tax=Streptomyces TaxID=1883 RepID=UPI000D38A2BA|nr:MULTISPECIES: NAD-dependent epimerase/dehydratase family protein [Streptomyces]MBY8345159.1 NAD-dependent epimerase/dehydratase family protein [Streptomyces plumbidurans]PTM99084.1 NAD-dependent epimerase/dehydratase family protein [Streptomyces sp. VMFN-G11Ma]UIR18087.1 NAD-dependent epimerase/dehydratase family protein [Streptomyces spinosirectus]